MNSIFKLAVELVRHSQFEPYNFVAIITDKKDRVLSIGRNSYKKTHPMQAQYAIQDNQSEKIYLHAEIDALVRCSKQPYKIFIARTDRHGKVRAAKPCSICHRAIQASGIKHIYWTTDDIFKVDYERVR